MKIIILIHFIISFPGLLSVPGEIDIRYDDKRIAKEIKRVTGEGIYSKSCISIDRSKEVVSAGKHFIITTGNNNTFYSYTGRVFTCPGGGCNQGEGLPGTTEYFDYNIIYSGDIRILSILIFNYQATHGQEVCARGWLKQFNGYSGKSKLIPGRNYDLISGATRSVAAITHDLYKQTDRLAELLR